MSDELEEQNDKTRGLGGEKLTKKPTEKQRRKLPSLRQRFEKAGVAWGRQWADLTADEKLRLAKAIPERTYRTQAIRAGFEVQKGWEKELVKEFKYVFKNVKIRASIFDGKSQLPTSTAVTTVDFVVGDSLDDLDALDSKRTPFTGGSSTAQDKAFHGLTRLEGKIEQKSLKNLVDNKRVRPRKPLRVARGRLTKLYGQDLSAVRSGQQTVKGILGDDRRRYGAKELRSGRKVATAAPSDLLLERASSDPLGDAQGRLKGKTRQPPSRHERNRRFQQWDADQRALRERLERQRRRESARQTSRDAKAGPPAATSAAPEAPASAPTKGPAPESPVTAAAPVQAPAAPAGKPLAAERSVAPSTTRTAALRAERGARAVPGPTPGRAVPTSVVPTNPAKPRSWARRAGRFALEKGKVILRLGAKALLIYDFVDGVLMVVSAVDYIVAWLQSGQTAEREEWVRLGNYLSWPSETTRLSPHDAEYMLGLGDATDLRAQSIMTDEAAATNFSSWLRKWDSEKSWHGFVYATITIQLERAELREHDLSDPYSASYGAESIHPAPPISDADLKRVKRILPGYEMPVKEWRDYPITYRFAGAMDIAISDVPPSNAKKAGNATYKSGLDPGNPRVPQKVREAGYTQDRGAADVEVQPLWVRYTYPTPILTPFDFIIAKANDLIAAIIAFAATYDATVLPGMDPLPRDPRGYQLPMFRDFIPAPPLNGPAIAASLAAIHAAVQLLSEHSREDADTVIPHAGQRYNRGYLRRQHLLNRVRTGDVQRYPNERKRVVSFRELQLQFLTKICSEEGPGPRATNGEDVESVTRIELLELAESIHTDITRAYDATKVLTLGYNYNGPATWQR